MENAEHIKEVMKKLKWKGKIDVPKTEYRKTIEGLIHNGYLIVSENEFQTVLTAPKKWNWTAFIALSLVLNIFGLIGYPIYYSMKKSGKQVIINKIESKKQ